jgi:DNA-binding CsgD family transcriptional regulator
MPGKLTALVLLVIAVLVGADAVGDLQSGARGWHVVLELAATSLAAAGVVGLAAQAWVARRQTAALTSDLARVTREAERWRQDAEALLRGLGDAIDQQFARWDLTPAEREIGLLLLKGLSLKEIAGVRDTSERTVRQQTLAIYRKSGLGGRAELAAFFLEDLLLPPNTRKA